MLTNFNADWESINQIEVTKNVYQLAGDLVMSHPKLRSLDALQISSAIEAKTIVELSFFSFDRSLIQVAKALLGHDKVIEPIDYTAL